MSTGVALALAACALLFGIAVAVRGRLITRPRRSRASTEAEFARALGLETTDPLFQAVLGALEEVGPDVVDVIGVDDDFQVTFGIVEDDVDDLGEGIALRLWGDTSKLVGREANLHTLREVVAFFRQLETESSAPDLRP